MQSQPPSNEVEIIFQWITIGVGARILDMNATSKDRPTQADFTRAIFEACRKQSGMH